MGFLASYSYGQPLLSCVSLVWSWEICWIPFPFGEVSSLFWLLCSWNVSLKNSPALDKLLGLWGKWGLSLSLLYSESDTWTCWAPVPWPQVMAWWDSYHHLSFWAPSSLQKFRVPFLFQDRDFSDFKALLMQDFITSYFSVFSAEIRFISDFYHFQNDLELPFF